jgi:uncharacterized protein YutE (UPF0331/DUF86 family)
MAFLFGSAARGRQTEDSDLDIAVYFYPETGALEWEEEGEYPAADAIWADIDRITSSDTDLVVLNRAPATVAYAALEESRPIVVKDIALYWRFFLTVSSAAEDFREFARDYWEIKRRSGSLSEIDRDRLIRIVDFLRAELADAKTFSTLSQEAYLQDSCLRRNVERWVENLVNASIDIGKIILASGGERVPQTYREILGNLKGLAGFDTKVAEDLAAFSKLRNILAHEYLDIRWARISAFLREAVEHYESLARFTEQFLSAGSGKS